MTAYPVRRRRDQRRQVSGNIQTPRRLLAFCLTLLLPCFVEHGDLLPKALGHRVLLTGVVIETNEMEQAIPLLYLGLQLVKPGSLPKRLQSAALGSAS